jgi:hypothetical protein
MVKSNETHTTYVESSWECVQEGFFLFAASGYFGSETIRRIPLSSVLKIHTKICLPNLILVYTGQL